MKLVRITTIAALAFLSMIGSAKASLGTDLAALMYSTVATETYLQFDGKVGLRSSSTPSNSAATTQVRKQLKYVQSYFRREKIASVRSDWSVKITGIQAVAPGLYRVSYHFAGIALIANAIQNQVSVYIPVNPDTVETPERAAACMDPNEGHGAFWYYWNPTIPGCPMVQDKDYYLTVGTFGRYQNTVQTYPEYNRLFVNGVARVMIMMGKPNVTDPNDPNISNPWSYPGIRGTLVNNGFSERILNAQEIQARFRPTANNVPFVEEFMKQTPKGTIVVTLFFGETALTEAGNGAFHHAFKEAIETASIIMYGGHAGTGKNLDISQIKAASGLSIQAQPNMYQILFLSACFPYAYYSRDYIAFKGGTKNLDVMAEGIEGGFDHVGPQISQILSAVIRYANGAGATSYQQILASDPAFGISLFSVSGDEDNPTSPSQIP